MKAGAEAGFELTPDYNGEKQEGFGPMEMTVHQGRRWSAANAYLRPALKRPNVNLEKGLVTRLLFDGRKCIGAEILTGGQRREIRVNREVVLAAGAINSPKILLQSGPGPCRPLRRNGD